MEAVNRLSVSLSRLFRHFHYIFEVTPLPLSERARATTMTAQFFGF
jgi:methylphosphotriester-DNA--protein-cysteine methyltransferase